MPGNDHIFDEPDFELIRRFVVMQDSRICPKTERECDRFMRPLLALFKRLCEHDTKEFQVTVEWKDRERTLTAEKSMLFGPLLGPSIRAVYLAIRAHFGQQEPNSQWSSKRKKGFRESIEESNRALTHYSSLLNKAATKRGLRKLTERDSPFSMSNERRSHTPLVQASERAFAPGSRDQSLADRAEQLIEELRERIIKDEELAQLIMDLLTEAQSKAPKELDEKKLFVKAVNRVLRERNLRIYNHKKAMCTLKVAYGSANLNGTIQLSGARTDRDRREGFAFKSAELQIALIGDIDAFLRDRRKGNFQLMVTDVEVAGSTQQNPESTPSPST